MLAGSGRAGFAVLRDKVHNLFGCRCCILPFKFRFGRRLFLLFAVNLHQMRAKGIVVIEHLAVQTLDTLVGIDIAFGVYGLHGAVVGATLAGIAAHRVAAQPVKHTQSGGNGQCRTERAEIAAIKTFDKQPCRQ